MLNSVTSRELTELAAYEMLNGPIGRQQSEELLASIHEQLQQVCRLLVAQNAEDEDDIPVLVRYPRPREEYYELKGDDDGS